MENKGKHTKIAASWFPDRSQSFSTFTADITSLQKQCTSNVPLHKTMLSDLGIQWCPRARWGLKESSRASKSCVSLPMVPNMLSERATACGLSTLFKPSWQRNVKSSLTTSEQKSFCCWHTFQVCKYYHLNPIHRIPIDPCLRIFPPSLQLVIVAVIKLRMSIQ